MEEDQEVYGTGLFVSLQLIFTWYQNMQAKISAISKEEQLTAEQCPDKQEASGRPLHISWRFPLIRWKNMRLVFNISLTHREDPCWQRIKFRPEVKEEKK